MKKVTKILLLATMLLGATCVTAMATPSTQIWIPSTDVQAFGTVHLGFDNYIRTSKKGRDDGYVTNNYYDAGITVGVLPFEKLQLEVGIDYLDGGTSTGTDLHPFYFNFKLGTPEDSLFKYSPALAFGMYNIGTRFQGAGMNKQDIMYALAAKTLPYVGRISAGYYRGSGSVLVDERGKRMNEGVLLSWDRTMSEISDNLWMGVDYMSGSNMNGALSFGVSWKFTKNISLLVGYDIYNNTRTGGKNTFTTQIDIDIPLIK